MLPTAPVIGDVMQSNRALMWVVVIGAIIVAGVYYLRPRVEQAPAPAVVPAASVAPARAQPSQTSSVPEPSPADQTAAEAAETLKQIEEAQKNEMMDKTVLPPEMTEGSPKN
jgi:hypothetical protein